MCDWDCVLCSHGLLSFYAYEFLYSHGLHPICTRPFSIIILKYYVCSVLYVSLRYLLVIVPCRLILAMSSLNVIPTPPYLTMLLVMSLVLLPVVIDACFMSVHVLHVCLCSLTVVLILSAYVPYCSCSAYAPPSPCSVNSLCSVPSMLLSFILSFLFFLIPLPFPWGFLTPPRPLLKIRVCS